MAPAFFCAGAIGESGLFPAGGGNPLDKLLLEDEEQYDDRDNRHNSTRHLHRILGRILSLQGRKRRTKRHHLRRCINDQRPHEVIPRELRSEDNQ